MDTELLNTRYSLDSILYSFNPEIALDPNNKTSVEFVSDLVFIALSYNSDNLCAEPGTMSCIQDLLILTTPVLSPFEEFRRNNTAPSLYPRGKCLQ
ncbi:hypothetical protein RIR_jg35468.t1 [Rhizophagus irregularis DAOM 181602=DAOM 197198]|nr:hypothetical protein RIR_jg35468.t1 [Rhizophagus irregularis DAOM 181602=DAOM 197198]